MIGDSISIQKEKQFSKLFTICSIVSDNEEYSDMKNSFIEKGFKDNSVFLFADNTHKNNFDAYEAVNLFLQEADSEFIILVHQDVRCIDNCELLIQRLKELESLDPNWAVCGNAGGRSYKELFYHIDNNGTVRKSPLLPQKVYSLDENLLIVKKRANLAVCNDINGFHFYGTDICIMADMLGFNSYVVPFMVKHLSMGNLDSLEKFKPKFIAKYGEKFRSRFIQTSCTKFYLSNSKIKNKFFNSAIVFFFLKPALRIFNFLKRTN